MLLKLPIWLQILSLFILLGGATNSLQGWAQIPDPQPNGSMPDPERPQLTPGPQEQHWGFLTDSSKRTDLFDSAKYIRLGNDPQAFLSLGLEYRIEYEYFDNWQLGDGPQDHNGYVLNRLMPHVDLHASRNIRLFTEFQFDYCGDRNGGPRPNVDEDRGDVHQAFLEIGNRAGRDHRFDVRMGRQEVVFGTGRLFDNNEGLNVKLSFDGFRTTYTTDKWRADLFALRPVLNNMGYFDDVPNHQESTWGAYITVPAPLLSDGRADLYYIGTDTKLVSYNRGLAREIRHTAGVRAFRTASNKWDYNWEGNYQWGAFGNDSISAWSLSTETGYTFAGTRFQLRPLLRVDSYSGDGNPSNCTLGTFNSLFPRGAYFTPKLYPFLGSQNLIDIHPFLQFMLTKSIVGSVSWNRYWRESIRDGVYAFGSGTLATPASLDRTRYLGSQADVQIRWAPAPHVITAFNLAGFTPGGFLQKIPDHRSPIAGNIGMTYRF